MPLGNVSTGKSLKKTSFAQELQPNWRSCPCTIFPQSVHMHYQPCSEPACAAHERQHQLTCLRCTCCACWRSWQQQQMV